jgi:hypothetical protein
MQQQTHEVLTNGLGSFAQVSPDYELAPVGLASMQQQAQRLAEHGRNGDIYVVHAAEGETVIPVEVLDANPMVKELLFEQMRDMGLDPGRYMVGNDLNSLNPETGMPEFFFKSIFKGIGKVIKKVVKVVKKVAPIVLPIAAAAFGIPFLGPAFGAGTFGASFVGSGIGSLLSGKPLKEAFKDAVIGGGLASLTGFAKGAFSSTGTALGGLEGSFTGSTPVFDAAGTQTGVNVAASPFGDKSIFGASDASRAGSLRSDVQFGEFGKGNIVKGLTGGAFGGAEDGFVPDPNYVAPANNITAMDPTLDAAWQGAGKARTIVAEAPAPGSAGSKTQDGFFDKVGDYMFRGGDTQATIDANVQKASADYLAGRTGVPYNLQTEAGLLKHINTVKPGMLARFGPSAAAIGLGAMAYDAFSEEKQQPGESDEEFKARLDKLKTNSVYAENPGKFNVDLFSPGFQPPGYDTSGRRIMRAAAGGATFDPFNYTGTPLNREYTPPIQYQDSRNIFNPNFSPPPAPVPTYLDFQSSYAPLDVDPYYQSGYAPTASDPNAPPVDLFKPFDPSLDEITGVATDETATSGIASIAEPVKPLFFFDDSPSDEEDDNATSSGAAEGAEGVGADEESTPAGTGPGTTGTGTEAGTGPGEEGGGDPSDPGGGAGPGGPGGVSDGGPGSPSGAEGVGADDGGPSGGQDEDQDADTGGDDADGPSGGNDNDNDSEGVADGGYIGEESRPRAQMLVEGPGTERSDDIPAMLSDGEFVLNARSVRGADPTGQGNRYLGAQNLYKMMRDFEMRA